MPTVARRECCGERRLRRGKSCTFDSGPGNSVDPPDSLPAGDVLAVVANSVTRSGPTITGTFTSVVEIQPDPGYAGDPGHDGTGTVVVTASCGGTF